MKTLLKSTLIGLTSLSVVILSSCSSNAPVRAPATQATVPLADAVVALPVSLAPQDSKTQEAWVRKVVEEKIGNGMKVDSVQPSMLPGVYEVRLGNELVYVDGKAEHLITGHIQDLKTGRDYTQERLDTLAIAVVFSPENKANALKLVKGTGAREIAVFEDTNCGYCKKLRAELEQVNNVTIYTYLVPILSQDSEVKMRGVWCAKDPNKAYDDWMLRGIAPAPADERCQVPVEANQKLSHSLRVQGTPAIFFSNGKRVPGYVKADQLEAYLAAAAQK
jgi:thiol:disulfide interchange protein DsbC